MEAEPQSCKCVNAKMDAAVVKVAEEDEEPEVQALTSAMSAPRIPKNMRVKTMLTRLPLLPVNEAVETVAALAVAHMGKEVALDSLGHWLSYYCWCCLSLSKDTNAVRK
jgi:hypothetical protein